MPQMKASEKLARAKTQTVLFQPFWASLLLRLELEQKPDEWFLMKGVNPDIATDGKAIYYSEEYIDTLTLRQTEGILAHVVAHGMLNHATRRDWREKGLWNESADVVVNNILKESQFELMENTPVHPEHADKSTEQVYAILEQQQKQNGGKGKGKGGGQGDGKPQPGSVIDASDSAAERAHQEQEWQVAVQQAAQAAKQAGNLPGSLERLLEEYRKPSIDWVEVLHRFFEETNPVDYNWFPPSKRYIANGDFLPSIKREGTAEICVAVDTSGSVSPTLLTQFVAEINCIFEECRPSKCHVLYVDTAVGAHDVFVDGEPLVVRAVGGGGTAFQPAFDYIKKKGIEPKAFLYLTDMEGDLNIRDPGYPILWVTQSQDIKGIVGETLVMPAKGLD